MMHRQSLAAHFLDLALENAFDDLLPAVARNAMVLASMRDFRVPSKTPLGAILGIRKLPRAQELHGHLDHIIGVEHAVVALA